MVSESIINHIETVSSELVLADPENDQDVETILSRLQTVKSLLPDGFKNSDDALTTVITHLKNSLSDKKINRERVFEFLSDTLSVFQNLTSGRFNDDELVYPPRPLTDDAPDGKTAEGEVFSLPIHLDEDILNEFLGEQDSVLQRMEEHLLIIEKNADPEALAELKRIFHTLKGESGVFGLKGVERICHATEDLIESSPDILPVDKLFYVKDWLNDVFDALKHGMKLPELDEVLLKQVSVKQDEPPEDEPYILAPGASQQPAAVFPPATPEPIEPDTEPLPHPEDSLITDETGRAGDDDIKTEQTIIGDIDLLTDFISEVQEHIDAIDNKLLSLENNPEDSELLNSVFRVFHTIKGAAGFLSLNDMAALAHSTENLLDLARRGAIKLTDGKIDHVFDAIDTMKKLVDNVRQAISKGTTAYASDTSYQEVISRIEACVGNRQEVQTAQVEPPVISHETQPDQPISDETAAEPDSQTAEAPLEAPQPDTVPPPEAVFENGQNPFLEPVQPEDNNRMNALAARTARIKEAIKVDSENLDKLIDAIGELVIIESMIRQDSDIKRTASSHLLRNVAQMEKITRELQQLGMSLRMIPVKATFQKMARVVRDLAKKGGKKIEFVTSGEDTMLDKSIVDRIGDPLIHLVRNCVDHGIESSSEERTKAGKQAVGSVELSAFHKGGNIFIEIKDDGKGLNKESVLEKAVEKGLISEGESLSDNEIYNLIFLPGFSTAKQVTDVSGRGVGMDVVKRATEELRGNIDIVSQPGVGTTFSMRLPLTLAIIDGMILRIGSERYIIPTLSIVEALRPRSQDIHTVANKGEMIKVRDRLIPLFRLYTLFKIKEANTDPTKSIIVIVEDSGKMTALLADELLGQQSIVIKNLGASMEGLTGISGGSIMSDGKVGIILDVAGIVRLATSKTENQHIGVIQ